MATLPILRLLPLIAPPVTTTVRILVSQTRFNFASVPQSILLSMLSHELLYFIYLFLKGQLTCLVPLVSFHKWQRLETFLQIYQIDRQIRQNSLAFILLNQTKFRRSNCDRIIIMKQTEIYKNNSIQNLKSSVYKLYLNYRPKNAKPIFFFKSVSRHCHRYSQI